MGSKKSIHVCYNKNFKYVFLFDKKVNKHRISKKDNIKVDENIVWEKICYIASLYTDIYTFLYAVKNIVM